MKTKFDVHSGCRQGGQEAPCLFNYYFDFAVKVAASEIDKVFPCGKGIDLEFNIPYLCTNREKQCRSRTSATEAVNWILYAGDALSSKSGVRPKMF